MSRDELTPSFTPYVPRDSANHEREALNTIEKK